MFPFVDMFAMCCRGRVYLMLTELVAQPHRTKKGSVETPQNTPNHPKTPQNHPKTPCYHPKTLFLPPLTTLLLPQTCQMPRQITYQ